MERYNRRSEGVDSWLLETPSDLRDFGVDELGMTPGAVQDAITAAQRSGDYPDIMLVGSESVVVRMGWRVIRTDEGEWGLTEPVGFDNQYEPEVRDGPTPIGIG